MERDHILHLVRTAIGRSVGQVPEEPPTVLLRGQQMPLEERIRKFGEALEKLGGKLHVAASHSDAKHYVAALVAGKRAVASGASVLLECQITELPEVQAGPWTLETLRQACASADVGITGADYGLADTGSLVLFATTDEPRMISLLPPVHVAMLRKERLLASLDDLFLEVPDLAERSSSVVIITGPSRTADIEQILVRGVHGPGQIHVVLV